MTDEFGVRESALEKAFFNKQNQELLEKLRAKDAAKHKRADLTAATGIEDASVLDALVASGIDAGTLCALSLAPLVLMAWRDGKLEARERSVILRVAEERGYTVGGIGYELIGKWLEGRPGPELKPAWIGYVKSLKRQLPADAYEKVRHDIIERTREMLRAAGGYLGIGTLSKEGRALADEIEAAFG